MGKVIYLEHTSDSLKDNFLGDSHVRRFPVYLPPSYEVDSNNHYPVIYGLTGFSGKGEMYLYKRFQTQSFDEMLDELIVENKMPEVIFVMPDCQTSLGGSQYVNSSAVGNYEDYIVKDLVPFIDKELRSNGMRACIGGSSGGIGSFSLAAKYPEIFQAFASHSGDSAFEHCFLNDVPKYSRFLEKYHYKVENFIAEIPHIESKDESFMCLLNLTAMAACYSPNPSIKPHGFDLPFDAYTGELKEDVWQRWLKFDPARMVSQYRENLKKLKFCYIDCGSRDQFHLFLGARRVHNEMNRYDITHHYEEYDSDHFLLRRKQKKKSFPLVANALVL